MIGSRSRRDLLARHRDRDLLLLGHHVLAQPRPARLAGLGADVEPLLGAGHRLVGGRAGGVATDCAPGDVVIDAITVGIPVTVPVAAPVGFNAAAGVGQVAVAAARDPPTGGVLPARGTAGIVHAVVAVELLLLLWVRWPSSSRFGASFTFALS